MPLDQWKEMLGVSGGKVFSQRDLETAYAIAFGQYERGEYGTAAEVFEHLLLHDPHDVRLWKGLASSEQMRGNYREALQAWAIHALLSGHSPAGHVHAAECYLSMGEKEEAGKALNLAEKFLGNDPSLQMRIDSLKEHL